jgi:hypothetical protein
MNDDSPSEPKLFISYSWSSSDHEAWVLRFAEGLASQGIHVILDKWDLQPGHDAHAFMESMITDLTVSKVVLICDQMYVDKSNGRLGGVGTEAQIITPELYAKKEQDKFVAVVCERSNEGKPFIPVYYGSRIYIDLTNPSTYGEEFDRIVRWAWGQPLYVRPEKGACPGFITAKTASGKIASSVAFRRSFDAIRNNAPNAVAATNEYLGIITQGLEAFRTKADNGNQDTFDDLVVKSIDEFTPYRNELIELFTAIAQYSLSDEIIEVAHRFFEKLIPYLDRPEHIRVASDSEFDNYRFIVHELFLYCLGSCLRFEKFHLAAYLIDNNYYYMNVDTGESDMKKYTLFRRHIATLSRRNDRLNLRRLSVRADMLKERNKGTGCDFNYIMTADFILYFRGHTSEIWHMWWPETLLYATQFGRPFEMFVRARSNKYFDKIKCLLRVNNKQDIKDILGRIAKDSRIIPNWQYESINPERLIGFDAIATTP